MKGCLKIYNFDFNKKYLNTLNDQKNTLEHLDIS